MINKEDKADVARHLGKALAKKVHKATDDSRNKKSFGYPQGSAAAAMARKEAGRVVRLTPLRGAAEHDKERETGSKKTTYFAPSKQHDGYGWKEGYKHKGLGSS